MNKVKINALVDILAFFAIIISAISGFVLWFFLPRGSGRLGDSFLDLARHNWTNIHNYSSLIFILLILVHLLLHWNWIKHLPKIIKNKKIKKIKKK